MTEKIVTGLIQICILSENLEETVQSLADNFGIGPWKGLDNRPPRMLQTHRNGKPAAWTFKLAVAWVGDVQLEVIESTGGPTVYREYLDKHGEGIQHLMLDNAHGYAAATRALEAQGYAVTQGTRINPPMLVGGITLPPLPGPIASRFSLQFHYHDTESALGTVLELSKMPPGISFKLGVKLGKADFTIQPGQTAHPITKISRVGILVEDLDAAMKNWEAIGIGPWTDLAGGDSRIATAQVAPVALDLVEPGAHGIYRTLIDTYGPGVRYLGVSGLKKDSCEALDCPILAETSRGVFIDARSHAHTVFLVE